MAAAVCAVVVALQRLSDGGLRGLALAVVRLLRNDTDHPHWELLAQ